MDKDILKEITLLYIEDNLEVQKIYSENLSKKVKELYLAKNGEDGYNQYKLFQPDIIITDIHMPIMTGMQMIKQIREYDSDIPIIITTAYNTIEFLTESLLLDISGYLVKPINNKQLFSILKSRAKSIVAKKDVEKKNKMLQAIINADSHILAVTNLKTITFANNTFENFFNINGCQEFKKIYNSFIDIFIEKDGFLDKTDLKNGEDFMDLMIRTPEVNRNVIIFDKNESINKSFYLKLTPINRIDNKDIYLATLIDITLLTIEKTQLQTKVYYDNLTNIYNRNKVDEVFKHEISLSKRYQSTFSLILIDIDHFKNFNDSHGHLIGDEVLVILAKTIGDITRVSDTFARWGGEEFLMILPKTTKVNASILAEHIRKKIKSIVHQTAGSISASFGVTDYVLNDTQETMYQKCDIALYKAKENGRDRVEIN